VRLGAHIGIAAGLAEAVGAAREIGCETIQIFSKSPQMWKGPPIPDEQALAFREAVRREGFERTAVHHGYLVNLASPKAPALKLSRNTFVDEIQRAEKVGADYLIFHPGAHLGSGVEPGLSTIVESLNWAFAQTPESKVRALLENAAGQGTALGARLEELGSVLARVERQDRVGVALDTCHLFAAGFELRTEEGYGALVDGIRSTFGERSVYAFHLNDAKADLGAHLDRHENIGKGKLGVEGFARIVTDARWSDRPGYLETPLDDRDYERYREDLKVLREIRDGAQKPAPSRRSAPARSRRPKG
jgi:deoxyribonuclease IV